jgi:hypothetical protein
MAIRVFRVLRFKPLIPPSLMRLQVTILVGLFILFSVYQLVMHLRQGTLRQHPLFAFTEEAAAAEGRYWAMQEPQQQI